MTLTPSEFNALPRSAAADHLRACCGASRWVEGMLARRPFRSVAELLSTADQVWGEMQPADWEEAFSHHPRIGERHAAADVSPTARGWSAGEQSAAARANASARAALAEGNAEYERRFGHIYIVCAAGRGAEELLANLEARLENDPTREMAVAAEEQRKITRLRLATLFGEETA